MHENQMIQSEFYLPRHLQYKCNLSNFKCTYLMLKLHKYFVLYFSLQMKQLYPVYI